MILIYSSHKSGAIPLLTDTTGDAMKNTIINTLRGIDNYDDLMTAIETLESVVYNFENPDCSCDLLRDAAPDEVDAYTSGSERIANALKLMAE